MMSDSSQNSEGDEDEDLDQYGEQLLLAIKNMNTKVKPSMAAVEKKLQKKEILTEVK